MAQSSDTPTRTALDADLPLPLTPSPSASGLVVSDPAPEQQATPLKRKREDVDDGEASGSSQPDNSKDPGPAAKKLQITVPPLATGRRPRRPKKRPPLVRKMWDKLMVTKLAALKLGATFSDFGFRSARREEGSPFSGSSVVVPPGDSLPLPRTLAQSQSLRLRVSQWVLSEHGRCFLCRARASFCASGSGFGSSGLGTLARTLAWIRTRTSSSDLDLNSVRQCVHSMDR